ncbi:Abi family protein [Rhodoglobus sp.]
MAKYTKKWLSIDGQLDKLESHGVTILDRQAGYQLLSAVGYYRVTGYLYPLRESESYVDEHGRPRVRVLNEYRTGTTLEYAAELINFDRELRMLVLDGIERIEISLRTRLAYTLGRNSAFAHLDPTCFVSSFTEPKVDQAAGAPLLSPHQEWLEKVDERRADSREAFVAHFRENYNDTMPTWALTEILELGQVNRLYNGLNNSIATEIADYYKVPTKKMMHSWISSLNYVRNLSAHHARLFNRKLVAAPARPSRVQVPLLGHMKDQDSAKQTFGIYNALAVMTYLLRTVDANSGWAERLVNLIDSFPTENQLGVESMGFPEAWFALSLWEPEGEPLMPLN